MERDAGHFYVLKRPWERTFRAPPESLYCEYFDTGPLGGASRLDSVLEFARYACLRRPLRRERLP